MDCSFELRFAWVAKPDESGADYEDSFASSDAGCTLEDQPLRIAVADGAARSWKGGRWARILASASVEVKPDDDGIDPILHIAGARWDEWRSRHIAQRENDGRPLKWPESDIFQEGPAATLLRLSVLPRTPNPAWRAVAIGDCNLFLVRNGEIVVAWPYDDIDRMPYSPSAVVPDCDVTELADMALEVGGELKSDDVFVLMTDALTRWSLRAFARGEPAQELLLGLCRSSTGELRQWAEAQWAAESLERDDLTLAAICIHEMIDG